MADTNVDDLLNEITSSSAKEQNVEDLLNNLGTYTPKKSQSSITSGLEETFKGLTNKGARQAELIGRGMAQTVPSTVAGFELGGPIGALVGGAAIPFGDTLNSIINRVAGTNLRMPSEVVSSTMGKLGYKEPQTEAERVVEAAGGGLGGASGELSSMFNLIKPGATGLLPEMGKEFTKNAGRQLAVAPVAAAGGQLTSEETGSPFAGLLASLGIGAGAGLSPTRKAKNAPTHEDLVLESKNLYDKAKSAGVQFDTNKFADEMFNIGTNLRNEGYVKAAYPGIGAVLDELTNVKNPKDFSELQALRKMIQGQQKSPDPQTRSLATSLKDDFDNYVLNAPPSHITTGTIEGMKDWADARNSYSRLKKSEIFDEMLSNAELDKSKFTQSGAENSMAMQLRNLAKNDKKMRTFTPEEQDAIREAAKGGTMQQLTKFFGRFAPTGPVTGIFTGELASQLPVIGPALSMGTVGARNLATNIRKNAIENLSAQMRLGAKPELTSRTGAIPLTALQGITAAPSQLNMNYLRDLVKRDQP
jgi:hypothetical protein